MAFREYMTVKQYTYLCTVDGLVVSIQKDQPWPTKGLDKHFENSLSTALIAYHSISALIHDLDASGAHFDNLEDATVYYVLKCRTQQHSGTLQALAKVRSAYPQRISFPQSINMLIDAFLGQDIESRLTALTGREPRQERCGYVYLLRSSSGLFKIGRTNAPEARLHRFEVALPFEVEFEHLIPCLDYVSAEFALHARYAHRRGRGEWFALAPEEVAEIKAIKEM